MITFQQKLHKFGAGACGTSCANLSFQGERVDRGTDGAGERDRRGREEELITAVVRAVGGEFLEVHISPMNSPMCGITT